MTLLVSATFGIIVALQMLWPDLGAGVPALGWGRLRYAHTQGIMLGWLGNAFLAFLYHGVPILTGRPVTSARLGLWIFGLWNFAVMLPGWLLVLAGVSQPLEWAEFPLAVDVMVVLALVLAGVQFLPGFFARGIESLYVSSGASSAGSSSRCSLSDGQPRAQAGAGGERRRLQRAVDPRRRRPLHDADGAGDHLLRHSGDHRAADLQPLPLDAGLLAAVLPAIR